MISSAITTVAAVYTTQHKLWHNCYHLFVIEKAKEQRDTFELGVPLLLLQRLVFGYIPQVLHDIAVQNQLCVPQRVIEDQIVQF